MRLPQTCMTIFGNICLCVAPVSLLVSGRLVVERKFNRPKSTTTHHPKTYNQT